MDQVRRCKKCIIPSSYEGVFFDEEGVCNFCANHKKCPPRLGRDKLLALINSVPRGKTYDCIVPLSGGKDSTFILYYAVKELKLRVIAISYDSGFQSPIAKSNMQHACGKLNVPLVIENTGNLKKMMLRDGFFLKKYGVPIPICENCETILRSICIRISRKLGIPFVL